MASSPKRWYRGRFGSNSQAVDSFVLILLLYELLVRRLSVVRFFFGMKSKKPPAPPDPRPEGTAA
jgi:hypothetical protein